MKFLLSAATLIALSTPAFSEGDVAAGEKEFSKCKSCHMIAADDGTVIVKGGKVGPNLYGVIGRTAGTSDGFSYGDGLKDAAAASFVWTEEELASYITDPKHGSATRVTRQRRKCRSKPKPSRLTSRRIWLRSSPRNKFLQKVEKRVFLWECALFLCIPALFPHSCAFLRCTASFKRINPLGVRHIDLICIKFRHCRPRPHILKRCWNTG
mgnify:CR=1 FL=1